MLSRFALQRTGSALIVVTTLLIPLNFWGMQVLGLFQHVAGWLLALPAAGWLGVMAYLCAAHVHREVGLRFALGFIPLAMTQAVIGFWAPWWGTLAVSLVVLGIVWQWMHLPEPPCADDTDRRTTWIYPAGRAGLRRLIDDRATVCLYGPFAGRSSAGCSGQYMGCSPVAGCPARCRSGAAGRHHDPAPDCLWHGPVRHGRGSTRAGLAVVIGSHRRGHFRAGDALARPAILFLSGFPGRRPGVFLQPCALARGGLPPYAITWPLAWAMPVCPGPSTA